MYFVFFVVNILIFIELADCFEISKQGYSHKCVINCAKCHDTAICLKCNPKYVLSEGTCTPSCKKDCNNGFCSSPDICQCNEGYLENPKTRICETICAISCGKNAYCPSPHECICKTGFHGNANIECTPCSEKNCNNGLWFQNETTRNSSIIKALTKIRLEHSTDSTDIFDEFDTDSEDASDDELGHPNGMTNYSRETTTVSFTETILKESKEIFEEYHTDSELTTTTTKTNFDSLTENVLNGAYSSDTDSEDASDDELGHPNGMMNYSRETTTISFTETILKESKEIFEEYHTDSELISTTTKTNFENVLNEACSCEDGKIPNEAIDESETLCGPCRFGDCSKEGICKCWQGYNFNNLYRSCQEDPTDIGELKIQLKYMSDYFVYPMETTLGVYTTASSELSTTKTKEDYCQNNCFNGTCINSVCQCKEGLILNRETNECVIQCGDNCDFGNCWDGGICKCYEDYFYNNITRSCQHSSTQLLKTTESSDTNSNCRNTCRGGKCIYGVCHCEEGLLRSGEKNECIKPCDKTCQNGFCNQKRICECFQGFVNNYALGCVPKCDPECINSICTAQTSCGCHQDIDNGRCQNRTCIAVNECQCLEGFILRPGSRVECVKKLRSTEDYKRTLVYILWGTLSLAVIFTILLIYVECKQICYVSEEPEQFQCRNVESEIFLHS